MKKTHPLKKSNPINLVEPLIKYLEINQSTQLGLVFKEPLSKINDLRTKAVSFTSFKQDEIDKYIKLIEMYVKYALLIAKHFNWNTQYGPIVQDLNITWYDSFNPSMSYMKSEIHYDIFCCYYNLGILHFHRASAFSKDDLISSRKQSMLSAKAAYYYFNQMRTYYYEGFVNTRFSDTNYPHLEMMECLSLGIFYKSLYNNFKENIFKVGISKVAQVASLGQINFFKAYQIGAAFFMKSSTIDNEMKKQILSYAYVEALYHDALANSMYAKNYQNQMDNDKENIIYLIAYQRKALRLLDIGLKNQSVIQLLNQRPEQKKQLLKMKPQIESSLNKNITRNKEIYKRQEIVEEKIPILQIPKEYIIEPKQPQSIAISYQGSIASLFKQLIDNDSKKFMNELVQFGKNRISGLQSALTKLQKNIQVIYNDSYANYYLNSQSNNKNKGIPEVLKKKIQQIKNNGGKQKLDMEISIIKNNSKHVSNRFNQLQQMIHQQEMQDNKKRSTYGAQWKRPPSVAVNRSYVGQIQMYLKKAADADNANAKILQKYQKNQKLIAALGGTEQEIISILPKVQIFKFLQEHKDQFNKLKQGSTVLKKKMEDLQSLTNQIKAFFNKKDFAEQASLNYKEAEQNRAQVLDKIFGKVYKLIQTFNSKVKEIEVEAKKVGQIATQINSKNKGDQQTKKQFEIMMSKVNEVSNLFKELNHGTSFYTKLNDILAKLSNDLEGFVGARKMEGADLQASLTKGGGGGGYGGNPNLPSMYPNQNNQNYGFYMPPPMNFNNNPQMGGPSGFQSNSGSSVSDMLKNLLSSKPNFDTDLFGGSGTIYPSTYKK